MSKVTVSRSAETGKFVTPTYAVQHPKTTVTETVKTPAPATKKGR